MSTPCDSSGGMVILGAQDDLSGDFQESSLDERLDEAEALARKILATQPENPDALNGLGLINQQQGRYDDAATLFDQAYAIDPERGDFKQNLIEALAAAAKSNAESGFYQDAIAFTERVLNLQPNDAVLVARMSFVLTLAKLYGQALALADRAISLDQSAVEAHDARGLALLGLKKFEHAITCFELATNLNPDYVEAKVNLGSAYHAKRDFKRAIASFDDAISANSGSAQAFNNLGIALADMLRLVEAETALRQAILIDPEYAEAHFNLSRVLLMAEKFREGWLENEWRWLCPKFPSTWREFAYPMWHAEQLEGKTILVWSEQGIGDEIMFANMLPDVVDAGATLVVECNDRLVPVLSRSLENCLAVARTDPPDLRIEAAEIDYQISLGSLGLIYRNSADAFPKHIGGYLRADESLTEKIRERYDALGDGLKVGICWRSGNPIVGHERSAPLELWDELLAMPGVQFVNLQYGDIEAELAGVKERIGIEIFQDKAVDPFSSAEDWFAQIAALDHVISVDNSTIQVSGSQGVQTWTLLSYSPEWRFGAERWDHLWHPAIRVFRQREAGKWTPLFAEVKMALESQIDHAG